MPDTNDDLLSILTNIERHLDRLANVAELYFLRTIPTLGIEQQAALKTACEAIASIRLGPNTSIDLRGKTPREGTCPKCGAHIDNKNSPCPQCAEELRRRR